MRQKILGCVLSILLVLGIFPAIGIAEGKNELGRCEINIHDEFGRGISLNNREIFYAWALSSGGGVSPGPISFPSDDPGSITQLAVDSTTVFAGTWAEGAWYAITGTQYETHNLITIDTATGATTIIGNTGIDTSYIPTGLTYSTFNDTMYATAGEVVGSTLYTHFYTIDLTTGTATHLGQVSTPIAIIAMGCDNNGHIYGPDIIIDDLYELYPWNLSVRDIGSTGLSLNYAQGAEYDKDNDIFYLAAYTTGGALYTCDTSDGSTTLVGSFPGGIEVAALAIPYNPNSPPDTPAMPSGATTVITGTEYTFSANTTDPNGDDLYYMFDWGDGSNTTWLGPYPSGAIATANHSWSEAGLYNITVKAKDVNDAESEWSPSLQITAINMFSFMLHRGWNFVTIPCENNYTASLLYNSIQGCNLILKWNNSKNDFDVYTPGSPNNFAIEKGVGYFISVSNNTNLSVTGLPIQSVNITLLVGWNSLGWFKEEQTNASDIYNNIAGCNIVLRWNNSRDDFDVYVPGAPDFVIEQGSGFFVSVSQQSQWHGLIGF